MGWFSHSYYVPLPETLNTEQHFPSLVAEVHTEKTAPQSGPLASASQVTNCTILCIRYMIYISECKLIPRIMLFSSLPSDEEQMLQESRFQI